MGLACLGTGEPSRAPVEGAGAPGTGGRAAGRTDAVPEGGPGPKGDPKCQLSPPLHGAPHGWEGERFAVMPQSLASRRLGAGQVGMLGMV